MAPAQSSHQILMLFQDASDALRSHRNWYRPKFNNFVCSCIHSPRIHSHSTLSEQNINIFNICTCRWMLYLCMLTWHWRNFNKFDGCCFNKVGRYELSKFGIQCGRPIHGQRKNLHTQLWTFFLWKNKLGCCWRQFKLRMSEDKKNIKKFNLEIIRKKHRCIWIFFCDCIYTAYRKWVTMKYRFPLIRQNCKNVFNGVT